MSSIVFSSASSRMTLSYPGVLQFLFLLTWVSYVFYLGDFLDKLGINKSFLPWLLILDQLLFLLADLLMGFFSSKAFQLHRRIGPALLIINLASCLIFIALPHLATTTPALFISMTIIWVLTSSMLRVPLFGLIAQRSANPLYGTAGALFGMGLASALAPYLIYLLKGVDPALPFTLAGMALGLATLAFLQWESASTTHESKPQTKPFTPGLLKLLLPILLFACGFQLHVFHNSATLYTQFVQADLLPWLMPVFWISFSLAVFPGAKLIERISAITLLHLSAIVGSIALLLCQYTPSLEMLIFLQLLAGLAWGGIFMAGLSIATQFGSSGREALFTGIMFALLAFATIGRILFKLTDISLTILDPLQLATLLWVCGGFVGFLMLRTASYSTQHGK